MTAQEWRTDGAVHDVTVYPDAPPTARVWPIHCLCCGVGAHVLYDPGVVTGVCPACLDKGADLP